MSNQHSKCDDCYKTHFPEAHDRIILLSEAFSEWYVPEFNQASENALEQHLLNDKAFQHILKFAPESQRELMTFELARYIDALIRTEKLKLLAEIREQTTIFKIKAHDKKGQPHLYEAGRGVPTDVLTKLEAEL